MYCRKPCPRQEDRRPCDTRGQAARRILFPSRARSSGSRRFRCRRLWWHSLQAVLAPEPHSLKAVPHRPSMFRDEYQTVDSYAAPSLAQAKFVDSGQLGHGWGLEEAQAGFYQPAGPAVGAVGAGAIGGDAGVGVHLAVEFGDEDEGEAATQGFYAVGALPNGGQRIETVPNVLAAPANLLGGH